MLKYVLTITAILGIGWLVSRNSVISISNVDLSNLAVSQDQVVLHQKFNQIKINNAQNNIVFKNGKQYKVYYQGNAQVNPSVTVNKQELIIKEQSKFIFNFHPQKSSVIIEMPKSKLKSASISVANGSVMADYLDVERGYIDSANGDIKINNLKTRQGFSISSANGDVAVRHANATGYDLSAANGDINFKKQDITKDLSLNENSKNLLKINSSNGNIKIK